MNISTIYAGLAVSNTFVAFQSISAGSDNEPLRLNNTTGGFNVLSYLSSGSRKAYAGLNSNLYQVVNEIATVGAINFVSDAGTYIGMAASGGMGNGTLNATSLYTNGNLIADTNGLLRRRAYTFGTLPAPGTAMRQAYITDGAAVPVWAAAAAGGGAVVTPVTDNGTIWING